MLPTLTISVLNAAKLAIGHHLGVDHQMPEQADHPAARAHVADFLSVAN